MPRAGVECEMAADQLCLVAWRFAAIDQSASARKPGSFDHAIDGFRRRLHRVGQDMPGTACNDDEIALV